MKIKILTKEDPNYPKNLLKIYKAPRKLYLIGNETILENFSLAIVGSRKASDYGRKITRAISYGLAKQGINIISGLAVRNRHRSSQRGFTCKRENNSSFRKWI